MDSELRVLLLEDIATDAEIIENQLRESGIQCTTRRVETRDDFLHALENFAPDVVLADQNLPSFDGSSALKLVRQLHPDLPVLIVTGTMSDDAVVNLIHEGAADYVLKDRLARLGPAVRMALERAASRARIRRLTKLHQVNNAINKSIVHTRNEGELFQAICDIAVRDAGFIFALIGEPDWTSGNVVVRASNGTPAAQEYLGKIRFSCHDDAEGRGAVGTAIRENRLTLIQDFLDDKHAEPLQAGAQATGIRACAAVPIRLTGHIIAVLVVASDINNYFDEEIINLLWEISTDVSVSLELLLSEAKLHQAYENLEQAMQGTIGVIAAIGEMRDPYTEGHEHRVGELAKAIGKEMGLDADRIEGLRILGYLHDVGKISVPAEFLSKPGKLSDVEFKLIKNHVEAGYEILKKVNFRWPIAEATRQHHERMDGSGYPRGLKAGEIMLEARILAVADSVEAMVSHRPYRAARGIDFALSEIEKFSGILYDPKVVATCLQLFRNKGYRIPETEPPR